MILLQKLKLKKKHVKSCLKSIAVLRIELRSALDYFVAFYPKYKWTILRFPRDIYVFTIQDHALVFRGFEDRTCCQLGAHRKRSNSCVHIQLLPSCTSAQLEWTKWERIAHIHNFAEEKHVIWIVFLLSQ